MPKTKKPKNVRQVLADFRRACENGTPSYDVLVKAIEFLLRREVEKERAAREHERIAEDALDGCYGGEYGSNGGGE